MNDCSRLSGNSGSELLSVEVKATNSERSPRKPGTRQLRLRWLIYLILLLATFAVYWPVFHHDFINFDDPDYILENPPVLSGLNARSVTWAFGTAHAANWHPVTWISHMVDVELFGLKAGWHHFTSLLIHAVNGVLLFGFLLKTTGARWRSALVAALFLLHPCHVESIAWIAERKDVLSGFFFLLTLWTYAEYSGSGLRSEAADPENPSTPANSKAHKPHRWKDMGWYFAALTLFALGLMCKAMLVTVPFLLLLLDLWPLGRLRLAERGKRIGEMRLILLEKAPFFMLSTLSSVITFLAQQGAGAVPSLDALTLGQRAGNCLVAYVRYLGKLIWPSKLAIYYPHPGSWPSWAVAGAAVLLITLTAFALLQKRRPFLLVGWFWFLGTLVPVIGLVQVGGQSMADRYMYIPAVGIFLAIGWMLPGKLLASPGLQSAAWVAGLAMITTCSLASRNQVHYWKNSETLFSHAFEVTPDNHIVRFWLGNTLADEGRIDEAVQHLWRAARLRPHFPNVYGKLGYILNAQGQYAKAASLYRQALEYDSEFPEALNNLAWLLATCPEAAVRSGAEAVALALKGCERTRYRKTVYMGTLAAAYAEAGRFEQAIATAERARSNAVFWGEEALAAKNAELLEQYREGKAYHEAPRGN
jgi:protein O-mannosyl-transferase